MSRRHPLADILLQHLATFRGSWVSKLTSELRAALDAIDPADRKRAATILIHGSATCPNGRERQSKRIKDGWQFCATNGKCACFLEHFHATSEATNLARRGVKNAAQSDAVKQKTRETCIERYGVETTAADPSRRARARATVMQRYGVENVFAAPEIKERIKQTSRERYGVDHVSQSPAHRAKIKAGVRGKYGVDNVGQDPAIRAKIEQTNVDRYGGIAPACAETVRQQMAATMLSRFDGHYAHQHIDPSHRIKGPDDFKNRFEGRRAREIAAETGYHPTMIYRYARQWNVELDFSGGDHRANETEFAAQLADLGLPIQRNRRLLLPEQATTDRRTHKEIDIYFPDHHLGVEFCGAYWHSDACGKDRYYHADKLAAAKRRGIDLLQVFEDEWLFRPEAVLATIRHRLGLTLQRVFARNCEIIQIEHAAAEQFYDQHHVFGGVGATVHIGLQHNATLVACMSFTERRKGLWDLVRYATAASVIGGASRLLRAFQRLREWETIISFADLRWSNGDLYRTLGFTEDRRYAPDYAYVVGAERIHKFNFRKSAKRFAKYAGQNLTERQMAELEGLPRVYDAGKIRFVVRRGPSIN